MEASIECTHCRIVMTSWSAPGSPIRYYQCPFCQRTHSSLYGEVFRRRAGARVVDAPPVAGSAAAGIPMASADDVRWARVKATATRWFARLEADQQRCATTRGPARPPAASGATADGLRVADPAEVVEVAPAAIRRKA
jgi:hypothetical protein